MRISGVKPVTFLIATVLILLASSLPQALASVTIAYDSGPPYTTVSGSETFYGVEFSLPSTGGFQLLTVLYSTGLGSIGVHIRVHITASDHVTELTSPVDVPVSGSCGSTCLNSLDVSGLGITVSSDFFVVVEFVGIIFPVMSIDISGGSLPSRSWEGTSMAGLAEFVTHATIAIRAVVNQVSPIPEYPLGLSLLATFMIIGYTVIKRRATVRQT